MVTLFTQACSKKYETVSPPLNAEGENPIFLAVSKKSLTQQHRQFHLYEIVDQETFLKNPGNISTELSIKVDFKFVFDNFTTSCVKGANFNSEVIILPKACGFVCKTDFTPVVLQNWFIVL